MIFKVFYEYSVIIWKIKCFVRWGSQMCCDQIPVEALVSVDTDGREQHGWIRKLSYVVPEAYFSEGDRSEAINIVLNMIHLYHVRSSLFRRLGSHHGGAAMSDFKRGCPDWRRAPTWLNEASWLAATNIIEQNHEFIWWKHQSFIDIVIDIDIDVTEWMREEDEKWWLLVTEVEFI